VVGAVHLRVQDGAGQSKLAPVLGQGDQPTPDIAIPVRLIQRARRELHRLADGSHFPPVAEEPFGAAAEIEHWQQVDTCLPRGASPIVQRLDVARRRRRLQLRPWRGRRGPGLRRAAEGAGR